MTMTHEYDSHGDVGMLRAWCEGDRRAGDALVRDLLDSLGRYVPHLLSKLGNDLRAELCEDIISMTILRLLEHPDRFRGQSSLSSYMIGVARNVTFEQLRRQRRQREHRERLITSQRASWEFEQTLLEHERSLVMHDAVTSLHEPHRKVLELRHHEQCSYEELGRQLGVSVTTAWSLTKRAQRHLASVYDGLM